MDSADIFKALLGLVTGALGTYFGLYWKIREELVAKYDQELRAERVKQYTSLWHATEPLAKYAAPGPVTVASLHLLATALRQWYFGGGGMFLSDRARDAYFALQDSIAAVSTVGSASQQANGKVPGDQETAIRKSSSWLRTVLTADVGSRKKPILEESGEA
jgi:hypothetical protein